MTHSRPSFPTPDPDAPAIEEELREAAALREALEDPMADHPGAALARALALGHAHTSVVLGDDENRELLARALRSAAPRVVDLAAAKARWGARGRVAAATGGLALAASVLLLVYSSGGLAPTLSTVDLRCARSTGPLFSAPFPSTGGASGRVDRIALARAADLRDNMFARWEVP